MHRVLVAAAAMFALSTTPVGADSTIIAPSPSGGTGSIGAEVSTGGGRPGPPTPPRPRPSPSGGGAGAGSEGPSPLDEARECQVLPIRPLCLAPLGVVAGGPSGAPAPVAGEVLAAHVRDLVTITVPRPRTSPDGAPQLAGLTTWFWLDPDEWRTATARAELPGLWAEVTATPVRSVWTPGDGSPAVTCDGPGRRHPGTSGATTTCGHPYTVAGDYTLRVAVTYAVTWRSSAGETGTQAPIVLTTTIPITVEQRQAVVR